MIGVEIVNVSGYASILAFKLILINNKVYIWIPGGGGSATISIL